MDAFDVLSRDSAIIAERLKETAANYSEWHFDRVFESTKKSLESIKQHFNKEKLLVNNLKDQDKAKELVDKFTNQEKSINSEIESIVMLHVDEPGFEQELETISAKFEDHRNFCDKEFYPRLEGMLTPEDMKKIDQQLEQIILR